MNRRDVRVRGGCACGLWRTRCRQVLFRGFVGFGVFLIGIIVSGCSRRGRGV